MATPNLWVETYRPKKIQDCILPSRLKDDFLSIVKKGEVPNMILTGTAGLGKTTVARALCDELDIDYLFVNASMEAKMDDLRNRIHAYATTVSLHGGTKVVILDEADGIPPASQKALRAFMETFSKNCRFILTCNYKNKLIDALHSRSSVYDFSMSKREQAELAPAFTKRIMDILKAEGVSYNQKVILELVAKHMPDWRRIINEVQRHSAGGSIEVDALSNISDTSTDNLMKHLKSKDFRSMRQWVAQNSDVESVAVFRKIFDVMGEYVDSGSIPQLVLILAEYDYKSAFVADAELNTVAALTEVMAGVKFK